MPETACYGVRRELRRSDLKNSVPSRGLTNLEALVSQVGLVPITSPIMLLATEC